MGPTPPGTGVMTPAFSFTPASQTSGAESRSFQMKNDDESFKSGESNYMQKKKLGFDLITQRLGNCQVSVYDYGTEWARHSTVHIVHAINVNVNKWKTAWKLKTIHQFCKRKSWHELFDYLPSKSTSPMSRTLPVLGSWMRLMPTSMTAAPSFTMSAVISPGTPSHNRWYDA